MPRRIGIFRTLSVASVIAAASAITGGIAHADPPITEAARSHFQAGVNLLRDPEGARYEDAYREFQAAYAASPSYKILGNLGLCAMKLERDGEAIVAYGKYVEHAAEIDPDEAKQVSTDLQTLKTGVVHVSVTVSATGAELTDERVPVRGEHIINQYTPEGDKQHFDIGVRAGHHRMTLRLAGYADSTWEFDGAAGSTDTRNITLNKASAAAVASADTGNAGHAATGAHAAERPVPTAFFIGAAATGALAVGGAVVGVMALGKHSDYESKNDGTHVADAQSLSDSGKKLDLIADILYGAAVVSAGITTYVFLSRPTVESGSHAGGAGSVAVIPVATPSGGGLVLRSQF